MKIIQWIAVVVVALLCLACLLMASAAAAGQTEAEGQSPQLHPAGTPSPYAGLESNDIKALTPGEVDAYLAGQGLGFAMAAELNHFPGPRHVLDLAEELSLSEQQVQRTQAIYDAMLAEAKALGQQLVDQERVLDRRFAAGNIDAATLRQRLDDIGAIRSNIRFVHLKAHLDQRAVLDAEQVRHYDRLRGYGTSAHDPESHGHH